MIEILQAVWKQFLELLFIFKRFVSICEKPSRPINTKKVYKGEI